MEFNFTQDYPESAREEIRRYHAFGKAGSDPSKAADYARNAESLTGDVRKFYKMLYYRSHSNKGFTRLYTAEFANEFNVSVRTIQRWLNILENSGLITRITDRMKKPDTNSY